LSLAEVAGEVGLPKGTVYGIMRTLLSVGFVEQDPESGKYRIGAALLHLGSSYLDGNELRTRALNWADWLAARTNESVRLGTLHDGQVLLVHHVFRPDNSPQVLEVGALLPMHATAMGKVLLAFHPYLTGPTERLCDGTQPRAELVSYVREGARTISRDLGAVPW
jgi:DNA-binding IclR family transcriptional regulator